MHHRKLILSLAILLFPVTALQAQVAAPAVPATRAIRISPSLGQAIPVVPGTAAEALKRQVEAAKEGASTPPAAGAVVPAAAAKPAKLTRLQAANKLVIDRRPSHILKEWSEEQYAKNPKPPKDDGKEVGKDDETKADDAKKAATTTPAKTGPENPFAEEMELLQSNIVMSKWGEVTKYFAELEDKDEAFSVYKVVLTKILATPPVKGGISSAGRAYIEKNVVTPDDVLALLKAAPKPHDDSSSQSIGRLLVTAVQGGNTSDDFLASLSKLLKEDETEEKLISRRRTAKLLKSANLPLELVHYLPDVDAALKEDDAEALNLLSDYYLAKFRKDSDQADLEQAWRVLQLVLASDVADEASQQNALLQAVSLSPTVRDALGQQWLDDSFVKDSDRGVRILATVGELTSQGLMKYPTSPTTRLKNLKLLMMSVEVLLEKSPELGKAWRDPLTVLAQAWLKESDLSYRLDRSSSRGPSMRYDSFGNPYFINQNMPTTRTSSARAITVPELLKHRPSETWIALLDESLQPRFEESLAKLFLKVQEEEEAFPYIEKLATSQPEIAKSLVNEFLTVWANNHDPNSGRRLRSPIFRIYGFSQRAEGIPLTRSQQERNLRELTQWLKRLQALPVKDALNEDLLVRAFTVCHSSAEVYELESIRNVFGDIDKLDPKTLSGLVQRMRSNLSGLWRKPDVQKQNKTNRRKKDIEAEVMRGYSVANQVIDDALKKHSDDWSLMLAKAALMHDEVNYRQEVAKSSKFTEERLAAIEAFRTAANTYAEQVQELDDDEESTRVYEMWFHASLGACDVRQIDADKLPLLAEPPMIREAILALPGESAERHMAKFANSLFTTLRSVSPAVKFRYLRNGFKIVGDHEQAVEAKKVFDYYDDLVTEIELHAVVDGSTNVGSEQPFGIFINLRHTREIERESGGFGRYLQNQNNVQYSYNYGRPTENYRDKFEEGVRAALSEHFEIESVTFQSEDVSSKADKEYGWRTTSYAYVLAKARGPEVDRIPPIKLDLDFLETTGYVVIPIESPMVPIDAAEANADSRPVNLLSIEQTLDERQAKDGKLILEVKATCNGLAPELDDLVDVGSEGFDVVAIDDQGVGVSRFDPESDETAIITERLWTVTFQGRDDLTELPKEFSFASVKMDAKESLFQRFVDADLESVEQTVSLEQNYGQRDKSALFVIFGMLAIAVVALVGVAILLTRKRQEEETRALHLPQEITPFSVIGVLREIQRNNGLNPEQQSQLAEDIQRLEGAYFAPEAKQDADLKSVAEGWLKRARIGTA